MKVKNGRKYTNLLNDLGWCWENQENRIATTKLPWKECQLQVQELIDLQGGTN